MKFEMRGALANNNVGYSVRSAGDINKDGYEDIIIGTPQKGVAYVIYGGQSFVDLSTATLSPNTTGFTITGSAADWFGISVSGAGDINNDGYGDIIIGAYMKSSSRGAAYVIYGGPKSNMSNIVLSATPLNPLTTGFMVTGNATSDYLGCSVSSAGDLNNDGFADILIGAYAQYSKGGVYVIYGGPKSAMSNIDLSTQTLDPLTTGFKLTGNSGENFGWIARSAGDIDNDGYDDIIIGASTKDSWKGAAYVVYGGPKSSTSSLDLSTTPLNPPTTGFMISGNTANDRLGWSLSSAGDLNKDGYADIIIGAYMKNSSQGAAYVIYGGPRSSMSSFVLPVTLDPLTKGFKITGNMSNDNFGYSVSSAGDINQDGYDDIIIGAYGANNNTGAAYVIYGGPKSSMANINLSTTVLDPLTTGFSVFGTVASGKFGNAVSAADLNNDGFSDLLIGAYGENTNIGAVYALIYNLCPDNCLNCSGINVCDVCSGVYFLNEGQCLVSCPTTKFGSNGVCQNCTDYCDVCSSSTSCTTCSGTYFLDQGQCLQTCPLTKFGSNGACEDCMMYCDTCSNSTSCEACSSPYLLYQAQCLDNCPIKTSPSNNVCYDCPLECSECTSESTCQKCVDGYTLTNSKCKKTGTQAEEKGGQKAAAGVFEGTSIIGSSLSSGSSLPLNFGLIAKVLRNIRYMSLPVSQELYDTFVSWKVASGFLSAPGSWSQKYSSKTLPTVFSRYELQTAFLINFWKPLMMTLIGVAVFGTFKLIEVSINDKKSMVFTISKKVNVTASNFALTQFYSNLDDVLFYFILEMRSTKFETGFRVCSSVLAIALFLVGGILLVMHSKILGKYQKLKEAKSAPQLEDFVAKFMNINLIFKDFKDTNSLTQSFLMINVGRSVLSSLIFVTLYEYPIIQISFLIILNFLMIIYLWNLKSFQEFINTCGQMFCEIVLFVANICVFILAIFDHAEYYPVAPIQRLGKCIIVLNFILLFGSAVLILVNVGKMLYQVYKNKKKPKQPSLPINNNTVTLAKFNRPSQSVSLNQSFSTNPGVENGSQNNFDTLKAPIPGHSNLRLQHGISKNYSIHHPTRSKNPVSFDVGLMESFVGIQASHTEDFGETSQANLLANNNQVQLIRKRKIKKDPDRIPQFLRRENNSSSGTPKSRNQDDSFNSSMVLNQEPSSIINQDVSLINFE